MAVSYSDLMSRDSVFVIRTWILFSWVLSWNEIKKRWQMQLIDMYVNNVTAHKSENFDPNFK